MLGKIIHANFVRILFTNQQQAMMRRKLEDFISKEALKHLLYVPLIVFRIKNWYAFLLNYIGFRDEANLYRFRNGIKIKTKEGVDSSTITVVFIKEDYGEVEDNTTIIDIGANIGGFSVFAASRAKGTKIYAYEPMPQNYALLLENIELNNHTARVTPFQLGVGAQTERRQLFFGKGSPFHTLHPGERNNPSIEIEVISLEGVFQQNEIDHCDLLKCDCEGAEFEILYHAPESCLKKIKEIRLEYHNQNDRRNNIQSLANYLKNAGFALTYLKADSELSGNAWFEQSAG